MRGTYRATAAIPVTDSNEKGRVMLALLPFIAAVTAPADCDEYCKYERINVSIQFSMTEFERPTKIVDALKAGFEACLVYEARAGLERTPQPEDAVAGALRTCAPEMHRTSKAWKAQFFRTYESTNAAAVDDASDAFDDNFRRYVAEYVDNVKGLTSLGPGGY